ncbi:hypothetical protein GQR58_006123 [Nymphon striatum]|nr:hypothetical protein GQR58_006123 [Nymphon striatum]
MGLHVDMLVPPDRMIYAYGNHSLKSIGCCKLQCAYKNRKPLIADFYIIDTNNCPLLCLTSCISLGLIKVSYSVNTQVAENTANMLTPGGSLWKYRKVFEGIGCLPGDCKIHIDQKAIPIIHPPRRVPYALKNKFKAELDRMSKLNVIEEVTKPTDWVNSVVLVTKPKTGELRVCLDPKDLNKAILRPHHPMRSLEDILPALNEAQYFTKLDARSGYWAIKLDKQSSLRIVVETDHKPLTAIIEKPLYAAPPRLQRMLLQLHKYDIDLTYVKGTDIPVADTLSRNPLPDTYPDISVGLDVHIDTILSHLPISDRRLQAVKQVSATDTQFIELTEVIMSGWPKTRKECPISVAAFWNYRDELSVLDGLILEGQKIVIPSQMRPNILETLHSGHMGVEKTLARARDVVFWPGITASINNMILGCSICLVHRNSNAKEPLTCHDVPEYPWQVVASDLFIEYSHVFGIPEKIITDNGPQYTSHKFVAIATEYGITQKTSSPHYPKSNGLAERTVQTVKRILTKSKADNKDPLLGILEYRTTPLRVGYSPSQILMGRRLRTCLPSTKYKQKMKRYHDKHAYPLPPLLIGEEVRVQRQDGKWVPSVNIKKHDGHSYILRNSDKTTYRRNRRHILRLHIPIEHQPSLTNQPTTEDSSSIQLEELQNQPEITEERPDSNPPEVSAKDHFDSDLNSRLDSDSYVTRFGRLVRPKAYDTIASMSSDKKGVQGTIAEYHDCVLQSLNLVICHACKIKSNQNMMDIVAVNSLDKEEKEGVLLYSTPPFRWTCTMTVPVWIKLIRTIKKFKEDIGLYLPGTTKLFDFINNKSLDSGNVVRKALEVSCMMNRETHPTALSWQGSF